MQTFCSVLVRALSEAHPRAEEDLGQWEHGGLQGPRAKQVLQGSSKGMVPARRIKEHTATLVIQGWAEIKEVLSMSLEDRKGGIG